MSRVAEQHAAGAKAVCAWCGAPLELEPDGDAAAGPAQAVACARCGVRTTLPSPSDAELEHAYGGSYRPPGGRFAGPGDLALRRTRGSLARRLDRLAPPGAVLDVGCGEGALLDELRHRGRSALGLERGPAARSDVRDCGLDELEPGWAALVFWHSLEHLRAPRAVLARASELLVPRGVLVIAVPNGDSLQARLFGERWLGLDLPRHLVHLRTAALVAELSSEGLAVERVSHLRGGQVVFGWLHGLVGLLPGRASLYDAIRTPSARATALRPGARAGLLAAGALLLPVALAAAGLEAALRRGGTVYVEARRA